MTAYTSALAGDVNVETNWTPNGIPTSADTVTINRMMTIPAGVTFSAAITAITGTSTSARAGFIVNGTLQLTANATVNAWNEFIFNPGSVLDGLQSFGLRFTQLSTGVNNKITVAGTEANPVFFTRSDYVSGEPGSIISTATITSAVGAFVDAQYLIINKMTSVLWGGGASGNHFRMRNCVWDDAGFFKTGGVSNRDSDWIIENCDYRHSNISAISSAYPMELIAARDSSGTVTGQKIFRGNTFKYNTETSSKYIRFYSADYFTDIDFVADCVQLQFDSLNTGVTYKNICNRAMKSSNFPAFGGLFAGTTIDDSVFVMDSTDYVVADSFHAFESRKLNRMEGVFYEEMFNQLGLDSSDIISAPINGNVLIKGCVFIMENGGAILNSWAENTNANITFDHNTIISRYSQAQSSNPYGMVARSETGNSFVGGILTITSNITYLIDRTKSFDGVVAAVNFTGTVISDQIDLMDNNTYFNLVPSPPTGLFRGVVSTTKSIGDTGYGANDSYVDPMMLNWPTANRNSPILAFAASKGLTSTKQLWGALLRRNGFNETTRRQETSHKPGYGVAEIIDFYKHCVTPSNPLLQASAYDGTSRGAVQFELAPEGGGGSLTSTGVTAVGVTAIGLTARGL